jgi:hypothetical protein
MSVTKLIVVRSLITLSILFQFMMTGCNSPSKNATSSPARVEILSGQVELHFKEFQQAKDLLAVFDLANKTSRPILYETYSFTDNAEKTNFCQLAAKQTHIVMQHTVSDCLYADNQTLQVLEPGENVTLCVAKWEVKETLKLSSDAPEISTKIGFEVFVGEKRQRQIVWSDTIVFPKTLSIASQ